MRLKGRPENGAFACFSCCRIFSVLRWCFRLFLAQRSRLIRDPTHTPKRLTRPYATSKTETPYTAAKPSHALQHPAPLPTCRTCLRSRARRRTRTRRRPRRWRRWAARRARRKRLWTRRSVPRRMRSAASRAPINPSILDRIPLAHPRSKTIEKIIAFPKSLLNEIDASRFSGPEQFFAGAPYISVQKSNVVFSTPNRPMPMPRSIAVLENDRKRSKKS